MSNRKTLQNFSERVLDLLDKEGFELQEKRSILSISSTWLQEEESILQAKKQKNDEERAAQADSQAKAEQEAAKEA